MAVPFLLITYGERWIPSSLAGILVASTAIFVVLLSPWLAKTDVVSGWGAVGVVVGILGVGLLFGVDLSGTTKGIIGGAMVLVASVGYALASIWVRVKLSGAQPVGVAAGTMIAAALATLGPAIGAPPQDACPRSGTWAALLALGAGGTGIAFLLYYTLIADIGASRAAVVAYMAPGFAVAYGALFLERADHGRDDRRPRPDPRRLVARRRGPPAVAAAGRAATGPGAAAEVGERAARRGSRRRRSRPGADAGRYVRQIVSV